MKEQKVDTRQRKISNIRFNKVLFTSILVCGIFISGIFYLWIYHGLRYGYEAERPSTETFETVSTEETITQEFIAREYYLKGIEFVFINLAEDGNGELDFRVLDSDGRIKANSEIAISSVTAGEWEFIPLMGRLKAGESYILEISAKDCSIPPYVLAREKKTVGENTVLTASGAETSLELLNAYGFAVSASRLERLLITVMLAVCLFGLWIFWNNEKWTAICKQNAWVKQIKDGIAAVLLVVQFVFIIPDIIYVLENTGFDPSWRYFLNVVNGTDLKFGRDIYFTYGPLGYLFYLMKLPGNTIEYWSGIVIWGIIFLFHLWMLLQLYRLYQKGKIHFWAITASVCCYLAGYYAPTRDNYLLYLMILAVVLWAKGAKNIVLIPNLLLLLMFFGKFSTFTSGFAFCILFCIFDVLFRKNWKSIWLFLPGIILMPVCYLVYCPSIKNLFEYVAGILKISSGWMLTMQFDSVLQPSEVRWLIILIACYVLLIIGNLWSNYKSSAAIIASCASMFFLYKYATTRHGLKVGIWLFAMLFSATILSIDWNVFFQKIGQRAKAVRKNQIIYYVCGTAMIMAVGCTGILEAHSLRSSMGYVKETLAAKMYHYTHLGENSIPEELVKENQLPDEILEAIGEHTVTVYPWRNGYGAVYPEWNMVWYPSVQNGNEYIPWLDGIVADWFCSEKASEKILLTNETIDHHIPYLENPLTWEAIRNNYEVEIISDDVCVLTQRKQKIEIEKLEKVGEQISSSNETIVCPENVDYVKIHLKLNLKGFIKKWLYHVGTVNMMLDCEDGSRIEGRSVIPNLESGFYLEKVPETLEELKQVVNDNVSTSIMQIQLDGKGLEDYQENVTIEWYCLQ